MLKTTLIKPTHKALKKYYAALQSFRDDGVTHEGALSAYLFIRNEKALQSRSIIVMVIGYNAFRQLLR